MPVIEANGATIDYYDSGGEDKPIVVLIHGWLGSWDYEFLPEIEWLRPHYRVLAPTRRGYGRSGPKPRVYARDFYRNDAYDLAAWLDALNIKQAHIVGFSDGGEVAILMPIICPDVVKSMTAWGAVGYYPPELRERINNNWPPTWVDETKRALHGPQYIEGMVRGWVDAMNQVIDTGGNVSLNEAHLITCPFLLVLGDQDTLNPEYIGRQLVTRARRGRLVMFEGGHSVHREHTEAFRQLLWEHLQAAEAEP